jgi:hypothetical protein
MAVTLKQVRLALDATADSVGKTKAGSIVIRRTFFYRNGMSSEKFTAAVKSLLEQCGYEFQILRDGEHYAPFRGGASVAQSSHWYVEVV